MPLINTVIDVLVVEENQDYILVEESDGSQYRMNVGPDHPYIIHETLQLRVDGLDRVVGEEPDVLMGTVLDSRLDVSRFLNQKLVWEDLAEWNPVSAYGRDAAEKLFPYHLDKTYRMGQFGYPESDETIRKATEKAYLTLLDKNASIQKKCEVGSEMLRAVPWFINGYQFFRKTIGLPPSNEKIRKQSQLIIDIANTAEPPENALIVLQEKCRNYMINLEVMNARATLGLLADAEKKKEEAIRIMHEAYMLNPFDPLGIRYFLVDESDQSYPAIFDQKYIEKFGTVIDPYIFASQFHIPVSDEYNPDMRPDYKKWQVWSSYYKWILIEAAHGFPPDVKDDERFSHVYIHEEAENLLACEPEARKRIARLIAQGMTRHQAIHRLGAEFVAMQQQTFNAASRNPPKDTETNS